jgi:phage gp45-like
MHRATPANTSFRAYVAGGARTVIHQADDSKLMQEMGGNFAKGESRGKVESPQNYGFTSVVMDADKGQDGSVSGGAEGFMQFPGGNRSFAVCGVMDDRRHRLKGLEKGDVAMFRTKQDSQQFHLTQDGGYWSAPTQKTVRMQLVDQQQQSGGDGGGTGGGSRDSGTGGSGSGTASGGGQQKGQSPVYKNGQNSYRFVDVTQDKTRVSGTEAHMMLSDGDSYVHCISQKTYLGGNQSKHSFAPVETTQGPSVNVYARIGSLAAGERDDAVVIGEPPQAASSSLLPVALALLLGISLGINYSVWPVVAANALQFASR